MKTLPPILTALDAVLCEKSEVNPDNFDRKIIDHAIDCGLGPVLFYCIRNNPKRNELSYYSALVSSDLTSQVLIGGHLDALVEILKSSPSLTKDIILLKGISTCTRYYPAPHMRTMADIDLLVEAKLQPELERICLGLGYRQESHMPAEFYDTHHHSIPLYHPEKNIWIEIHTSLFSDPATVANDNVFSIDHVFQQTISVDFKGFTTKCLNNEMELVYTCSHWAEGPSWIKSLIQMLDMLLIIKKSKASIAWDKLLSWLEHSSSAAHLYIVLSLLHKNKLICIPNEVLTSLSKKQHGINGLNKYILHAIMSHYIFLGHSFGNVLTIDNINIIWSTLLLEKTHPVKRLFLQLPWNLLFPPNSNDRYSLLFQLKRIKSVFERH